MVSEPRVTSGFDVIVVRANRAGEHELAIRNGVAEPYTDRVRPAVQRDRQRAIAAVRGVYPNGDLLADVEQKLLAAAASDRKARSRKQTPRRVDTEPFEQRLTDIANAARFAKQHRDRVRYIDALGGWFEWDDRRWLLNETGVEHRLGRETQRAILLEATREQDTARQKALADHAFKTAGQHRQLAMIGLATSEPDLVLRAADMDADPMLLTVANGTLDLRTGELRDHRREDNITRMSPVAFAPKARSETWDRFLREATGRDQQLELFLQRAAGYGLTGDTREEKLFFVHGPPASGKSTFLEALKATWGDYVKTADAESFTAKHRGSGPRDDLARLAGARLVVSIEIDEGKQLAAGVVKSLTGGDTVAARLLYKSMFEFRPQFKLWIAANDAPRVKHTDAAMWRRILRLPFETTVPEGRRDPALKVELCDPKRTGPAILAWAVRGCLAWQERGLDVPDCVKVATEHYREDQDLLRQFIEDCCELGEDQLAAGKPHWVSWRDLNAAHDEWAHGDRHRLSSAEFREGLRQRGCQPETRTICGTKSRGWVGIRLKGGRDE